MGKKSRFEIAIIDRVRELRVERNLSQQDIAAILNSSSGFIGQIESANSASKYNFNHLNKLAQAFGCSPKDFMPDSPVNESVRGKKR